MQCVYCFLGRCVRSVLCCGAVSICLTCRGALTDLSKPKSNLKGSRTRVTARAGYSSLQSDHSMKPSEWESTSRGQSTSSCDIKHSTNTTPLPLRERPWFPAWFEQANLGVRENETGVVPGSLVLSGENVTIALFRGRLVPSRPRIRCFRTE